MILDLISFASPLLLASAGALYTEYTGSLALYLEGLITYSAFLMYYFTSITSNFVIASLLCTTCVTLSIFLLALLLFKTKANLFIASIALNLFFAGFTSFLSSIIFNTRGVLSSPAFYFTKTQASIYAATVCVILLAIGGYVLFFTQKGIYFRTAGTESNVLSVKGINPSIYKIASWAVSGIFASQAGIILAIRVSSFVPNISSGRGWMALAAVYLGKKKLWKIILFVLIFCAADFLAANLQNYFPQIPSAVLIALPYLTVLLLSLI